CPGQESGRPRTGAPGLTADRTNRDARGALLRAPAKDLAVGLHAPRVGHGRGDGGRIAGARRVLRRNAVFRREARTQSTVARDPQAVAPFAIRVAGAGDEAGPFRRIVPGAYVPRGAAVRLALRFFVDQEMAELHPHLCAGDDAIGELCPFADGHDFEEPRNDVRAPGPLRERLQLIVVFTAHDDGVELHLVEACG